MKYNFGGWEEGDPLLLAEKNPPGLLAWFVRVTGSRHVDALVCCNVRVPVHAHGRL